mmetsp:Transcript_465/g.1129  ORF Transcript_465/g.1129 Transcript_465/m.1129 type:complete len:282 (-) Transcript_465:262-1107(-)
MLPRHAKLNVTLQLKPEKRLKRNVVKLKKQSVGGAKKLLSLTSLIFALVMSLTLEQPLMSPKTAWLAISFASRFWTRSESVMPNWCTFLPPQQLQQRSSKPLVDLLDLEKMMMLTRLTFLSSCQNVMKYLCLARFSRGLLVMNHENQDTSTRCALDTNGTSITKPIMTKKTHRQRWSKVTSFVLTTLSLLIGPRHQLTRCFHILRTLIMQFCVSRQDPLTWTLLSRLLTENGVFAANKASLTRLNGVSFTSTFNSRSPGTVARLILLISPFLYIGPSTALS